ncbi:hypothetical protein KIN20_034822 [Parelaphostrongylus tenuis]|uniref:Uncharacterized protein n=1 Tax=Parelaphostrongylus tenuis TaxID=148309 RepID=A0AAD5RAX1_PARTN|nr:hypothetical protein KIN20_034822 [Parelaphostrongylus tenuis]
MDKLERSLGRLWRRISGGKRKQKGHKKIDGSKYKFTGEQLTSDSNPQGEEETKSSSMPYCLQNQSSQMSRTSSPSQDLSRALVRLYVYARLKSLKNLIVVKSSLPSDDSITTDLESMDLISSSLEQSTLLTSLPQLSSPLRSHEFQKLRLSRESGYLTNSPCDYSSSSETLKQQMSPTLYLAHEFSDQAGFTPKEKFYSFHAETIGSSALEFYLSRRVYKSKCVTCVFEADNAGLVVLMDDILAEFKRWFIGKKMLVVASELHFSVPFSKRCRKQERILKQQMLHSLHENNRRILCLDGAVNALPENLARSKTEENIYNDNKLQAVQGVYQRCYHRFLPFVHVETPTWHAPYWKLLESPIRPCSSAFLLEDNNLEKLRTHSFVSLNIIGLTFHGIKSKKFNVFV